MHRLAPVAQTQTGGLSHSEWCEKFLRTADWLGTKEIVKADTLCDDQRTWTVADIADENSAMVFVEPKSIHDRKGAWDFTPLPFRIGLWSGTWAPETHTRLTGKPHVVVPLGVATNSSAMVVLKQKAREWCSGGGNNVEGLVSNVPVMMMGALRNTVFAAAHVDCKAADRLLFVHCALKLLVSLRHLTQSTEEIRKIVWAAMTTELLDDVLQRMLSYCVFSGNSDGWQESYFRMIEVMLKRETINRHRQSMMQAFSGPMAVLVLCPLLRREEKDSMLETAKAIHQKMTALHKTLGKCGIDFLTAYQDVKSDKGKVAELVVTTDVKCLMEMFNATLPLGGLSLTVEQWTGLVRFCRDEANQHKFAPLADLGFVPKIKATFNVVTDGIYLKPGVSIVPPRVVPVLQQQRPTVKEVKETKDAKDEKDVKEESVETTATVRLNNLKTVDWTGIGLVDGGRYLLQCDVTGVAAAAQGNSLKQELVANWRVTTGQFILPPSGTGISSAGMQHVLRQGRWKFEQTHPAFNLDKDTILALDEKTVKLFQPPHKLVFEFSRPNNKDPVVLGWKNMNVELTKLDDKAQETKSTTPTATTEEDTAAELLRRLSVAVEKIVD
jgi:hypothetical protein